MTKQETTQHSPTQTTSLLLEIGTEEIPARFIPPALDMLKGNAGSIFHEYLIGFSEIKTYATPRRLTAVVRGIPPLQQDRVKEVFGPSKKVAYDEQGNPTKAAVGFAQSQGIEVSQLVVKNKDKGEYVAAVIQQKGVEVKELLPEMLKKLVLSLTFPKSMRWGYSTLRFVRPLHWIVAILDREVIPFDIDSIRSGNITRGHRFLSPVSFVIKEVPSYFSLLENNYVIVDQDERKRKIISGITALSSSVGGRPVRDEDLLDTVTHLVEYPTPVLCEFPADYLRLPKELLITVMKDHQKYFAVEDAEGNLKSYFVVVSNTKDENAGAIKTGAERVIKARFEDARFYYEEDIKKPLGARIPDLKRVTFHDRLGSLHDKAERVAALASFIAEKLFPEKKKSIERAAWLSKTDLITGVVGEFPELQGLMGRYYALHEGEDREVAEAIRQQYLPAYSGDRLPETDEGSVLSLADKMDNIVSFFSIGLTPTGSEDPFALRRQALAVIGILIEKGYAISLRELIRMAQNNTARDAEDVSEDVLSFFIQRLEPLFLSQGFDLDMIQSVIHFADRDNEFLAEMKERLRAIKEFSSEKEYSAFLLAIKRVTNIGAPASADGNPLRKELLTEVQEKILYEEVLNIKPSLQKLIQEKKYYDALKLSSTLTKFINAFFDGVLVMDKRDEVKLNRFALLREICSLTSPIADFSRLKEAR